MKIGEAAEALDTSIQTLRLYESNGLIKSRRTAHGTRFYNEDEIRRLKAIRSLNELGIPYHQLKELSDIRLTSQSGHQASEQISEHLKQIKQQFINMRQLLEQYLGEINISLSLLEQCAGCKKSPRRKICARCEVSQGLDQADILQLIWDQPDGLNGSGL